MPEISPKKIYPKKSLGQNYLTDDNISRNIVETFNIQPADIVIEIGSGQGAITKYIIKKTKSFTGIEFDKNNYDILKKKFPDAKFINEDFLKTDLNQFDNNIRIIGNIPYNLTTEIVFKLIDNRSIIKDAQLMIQDEVAKRFTASPDSTKEYGITSVFVQTFSQPKLLFKVSNNCFNPKPKVDSRIIHFDLSLTRENKIKDIEFFRKFVRAAFSTRRKTLKNSLSKLELDLSKVTFDFSRRAESLSVDEFIELSNLFV